MTTKGITNTTKILFAAALIGLSACKNDIDNTAINGNKINTTIEIVEQEYQSTSPVTRAVINNSSIQNSELVGDLTDCSAYSDVVPNLSETQSASTRALSIPTHYTVRFYLGSTKAGELKGTHSTEALSLPILLHPTNSFLNVEKPIPSFVSTTM